MISPIIAPQTPLTLIYRSACSTVALVLGSVDSLIPSHPNPLLYGQPSSPVLPFYVHLLTRSLVQHQLPPISSFYRMSILYLMAAIPSDLPWPRLLHPCHIRIHLVHLRCAQHVLISFSTANFTPP